MYTSVILSKLSTIAEVLSIAFEARTMAFSVTFNNYCVQAKHER